ncbi:MAG TPA: cation diffusion facilitator family transporter [candidate division Zixibacteria bacterium]|nr:cation diffusion facilitator family transporter [candidate division Zixibacteria bacterium]
MHSHAGHHHGHLHLAPTARILRVALVLTAAYIVLLVVAGVRAHSLALLSEAGHNVSDFLALLLSWFAVYLSERPPTDTKTYGYQRAGVLAAFVNACSLVLIALLIFYEAIRRLYRPEVVEPRTMMAVAFAGVVLNGGIALLLLRGNRDLNIRSALVHEIGDTLSTAAVILGGWAIAMTGHSWIDPALSIVIGALILWSSYGIIRESLNILLEGTPYGVKLEDINRVLKTVAGVNDVHDLHVWSIGSHSHALSCHISIADIPPSESDAILARVREMLQSEFKISHTTIQFESAICDVAHGCLLPVHDHHQHEDEKHSH